MSLEKVTALVKAEHSKKQELKIIHFVGTDQLRFNALLKLCLGKNERLAQCASWPLAYCVEAHPELAKKNISKIIDHLYKPSHHAVRRNFLRLLRYVPINDSLETKLIEVCFRFIQSADELLANKVFSIYLILTLCKKYPELYGELKAAMDLQISYQSPGFKSAARRVEKEMKQSQKIRLPRYS